MIESRPTTYGGLLPGTNARETAFPKVVYWSERICGWWPGLSRVCPSCIGGRLDATPPNTPTSGPGSVSCLQCGREAAEVRDRPRARMTPSEFHALPIQSPRRPLHPDGPTMHRLIRLLSEHDGLALIALTRLLDVSEPAMRNAVTAARKEGYRISCHAGFYRLERES